MSQKVKEKLLQPLFQKEKCRELVVNFKKSIELWFLSEADDTFKEIQSSCFDIILYGLVDITHQKKVISANFFSSITNETENIRYCCTLLHCRQFGCC